MAHTGAICIRFSNYRVFIIVLQSYRGSKRKSYKIMKMQIFATQDKAKLDTENVSVNLGSDQLITVK
jgi:hypothetical protein